jgi:hypothetical protein
MIGKVTVLAHGKFLDKSSASFGFPEHCIVASIRRKRQNTFFRASVLSHHFAVTATSLCVGTVRRSLPLYCCQGFEASYLRLHRLQMVFHSILATRIVLVRSSNFATPLSSDVPLPLVQHLAESGQRDARGADATTTTSIWFTSQAPDIGDTGLEMSTFSGDRYQEGSHLQAQTHTSITI